MPNSWGRPPRNEFWQDIQALALWIVIIGIVGFLLFPEVFKDAYSRIREPSSETTTLGEVNLPESNVDSLITPSIPSQDFPSVYNSLYNGRSEVSTGYWVIFVADGEFKQFAVNSDSYTFLLRLIESDQKAIVKNTVILVANGQIQKYIVSDEIYSIITNMALIDERTNR